MSEKPRKPANREFDKNLASGDRDAGFVSSGVDSASSQQLGPNTAPASLAGAVKWLRESSWQGERSVTE